MGTRAYSVEPSSTQLVVDIKLVRIAGKILVESWEGAEALVELMALGKLVENGGLVHLLGQQVVLVQHLPDVEVASDGLRPAEEVRLVELEPCLKLGEGRLLHLLERKGLELLLVAGHLLEGIRQLDHPVADIIDLAKQLVVLQLRILVSTTKVELLAQVVHDGVRLTNNLVSINKVRKVGERVLGKQLRLPPLEPRLSVSVLLVLEWHLLVL
mmetsp:Transcript_36799/g.82948  ORF Transcript_36799/g.82948 Transcript_36799/m.82948 type:complete len:213 (-) Transcript_36799:76-714(-)